jgi:hypothetical protein
MRDETGGPAAPLSFAGAMLVFATFMLLQFPFLHGRPTADAGA